MKKFLKTLVYIFAILWLVFVFMIILSPYKLGSVVARFSPIYLYMQKQSEPIAYDVPTKFYDENVWEFDLTWNNAFIFDLKDFEISVQKWVVSYKAFYFNPEFTTLLYPVRYAYADNGKLGEWQNFNCVKILKNVDEQENPDWCKIFTINKWLLSDTFVWDLEYDKLFVYITAFKEWAKVDIK